MQYQKRVPEATERPLPNPVGRPPASKTPSEVMDAQETVNNGKIATRCPHCGRSENNKVTHRRPSGERDMQCKLCLKGFIWSPGTVRAK